jgi:predicted transcriptional regulator
VVISLAVTSDSLRKLRLQAGMTQKQLATLAGVSQAHVAKIESGNVDPRLSTVNRILDVLGHKKGRKCGGIMTRGVIYAKPGDSVLKASEIMIRNAVSQLPVHDGSRVVGTITEQGIVRNLKSNLADEKVRKVMDPPLAEIQEDAGVEAVRVMLEKHPGVLVKKRSEIVGIITRTDLLKTIG